MKTTMRIIIPANEAKIGDDCLLVKANHIYSKGPIEETMIWETWKDGDKPKGIWSREIEPWVKVEENRYPEDDFYVEVLLRSGERANARVNQRDLVWMDFYGNLLDGVVAWFDTSLFPAPPKRDECEEAWLKVKAEYASNPNYTSEQFGGIEIGYKAAWKAARGTR